MQQKQAYVVAKIVDARYNITQFADFLDSKRHGAGSDISIISMQELTEFVNEFTQQQEAPNVPASVVINNGVENVEMSIAPNPDAQEIAKEIDGGDQMNFGNQLTQQDNLLEEDEEDTSISLKNPYD